MEEEFFRKTSTRVEQGASAWREGARSLFWFGIRVLTYFF
jgi:hypothetical protein